MEEFKKPVLVLGANPAWQKTLNCQRLVVGEVVRAKLEATGAAGKGFNTAHAVRAFGIPVVLVSAVGTDAKEWEDACREEGIQTRRFPLAGRIRTATTIQDQFPREVTEIVEEGPEAAEGAAEILDSCLREELGGAALVVVAGTFPPGLSPRSALIILLDATVPVIVDSMPAIRALRDMDRSPSQLTLKLNETEWKALFGVTELFAALRQARRLWPLANLLATRGKHGAVLLPPDGMARNFFAPDFHEAIHLHPIGAGDAFTGGFAVRLVQGRSLEEACSHGMAVARASCLTPLPARFSREEVAGSLALVTSEPIDG